MKCVQGASQRYSATLEQCQEDAAAAGKYYIQYTTSIADGCFLVDNCNNPIQGTSWDWRIFVLVSGNAFESSFFAFECVIRPLFIFLKTRLLFSLLLENVHKEESWLNPNVKVLATVVSFHLGKRLEPTIFQKRVAVSSTKMGSDILTA